MSIKEVNSNDEISVYDLLGFFRKVFSILKKRAKQIIGFTILGFLLGFAFIKFRPVEYISRISFVVEESSSAGSGLSSIAGQLGVDLGGSGGGGIFSGGNVILFLQSESLCRDVLLTPLQGIVPKTTLADRYTQVYGLQKKWAKKYGVGPLPFQTKDGVELSRFQDSLMQLVIKRILEKDLTVAKPDKKGTFVEVEMSTRDEDFSKLFCEVLVQKAIDQYLESKNKYRLINVQQLQNRVDSLSAIMTSKTVSSARSKQSLVDLNPAVLAVPVTNEILNRDMTMTFTIFAEVYKNLQVSKSMLSQQTPVVEIVESSRYPLRKNVEDNFKILIISTLVGLLLASLHSLFTNWRASN